jgi:hypothetical protein
VSATATGWTSSGGTRATPSRRIHPTTISGKSKNWVARRMVKGDRAGRGELLLTALARVVGVALDPVDADDREHDVMPDARSPLGLEQMTGLEPEEVARFLGVRRHRVRDVDRHLDPGQDLVEPLARGQVDTPGAGDHDRLVAPVLQGLDHAASHQAGAADDSDSHGVMVPDESRPHRRS